MTATPTDPRRTAAASRFLVGVLVGLFLLGLLGFAVAVLEARPGDDAAAPPSVPVIPDSGRLAPVAPPGVLIRGGSSFGRIGRVLVRPWSRSDPGRAGLLRRPQRGLGRIVGCPGDPARRAGHAGGAGGALLVDRGRHRASPARARPGDREAGGDSGGSSSRTGIRAALAASLGVAIHPDVAHGSIDDVRRAVRHRALGLVAAADLVPSLRPLRLDGRALVGNDRVDSVGRWPLVVELPLPEGAGWDQARTWVLVAGGDAFTDRGVHDTVVRKGRGVDFPFDGGTATVTGHGCCDPVYHDNVVPRYRLTGRHGRRAATLPRRRAGHRQPRDADHRRAGDSTGSGFIFSGRPDLTRIFTSAGIDWVSLANNHIKDYGSRRHRRHAPRPAPLRPRLRRSRQGPRPGAPASASSRWAGRASRSSPAWTWRRPSGPARDGRRDALRGPLRASPTSSERAAAVRTSSSSSRTGASSTRVSRCLRCASTRQRWRQGRCRPHPRRPQPRGGCHRGDRRRPGALLAGQPHLRPALVHEHDGISPRRGYLPGRHPAQPASCSRTSSTLPASPNLLDPRAVRVAASITAIRGASADWLDW